MYIGTLHTEAVATLYLPTVLKPEGAFRNLRLPFSIASQDGDERSSCFV